MSGRAPTRKAQVARSEWLRHRSDVANAARTAGARALLAHLHTIADDTGRFAIHRAALAEALGSRAFAIDYQLSMLRIAGAIAGERKGWARITGYELPPPPAKAEDEPVPHPNELGNGCDYPTCRAMGIEPVVHLLHHRTLRGDVGVGDIAITLARIPSLEKPLAPL